MYISMNGASVKFNISKQRVHLREQDRISGTGVWSIPETAHQAVNGHKKRIDTDVPQKTLTIDDVCKVLSISRATAKNWIRLGKIVPDMDGQLFTLEYIEKFIAELKSDDNTKLKRRRNKKSITGKVLYKDYVHTESNQMLATELIELGVIENEKELLVILANFAVQLYYQSRNISYADNRVLLDFLSQHPTDDFNILIKDLLGSYVIDEALIQKLQPALTKEITFVKGEDSLGFIYISLQDIGRRKSSGAYYTPEKVVNKLIERLYEQDGNLDQKIICDPCCGGVKVFGAAAKTEFALTAIPIGV